MGSLLCGFAPDLNTLIVGRAITGLVAASVGAATFTIIGYIAAPERRPIFLALSGAVYGIAAVLGPITGRALTSKAS